MRLSFIATASFVALLAACSSTPPARVTASAAPGPATSASAAPASTAQSQGLTPAQLEAQRAEQLRKQQAELNAKSVFFDFDDFTVKPDYTDMLQQQVTFLKSRPGDHLVLQGNSDERGGAEYNLALGQKRADAVRKAMALLGAPVDRIETISFGKEKPRATCSEESCWSQNRRTDFVHSDKP